MKIDYELLKQGPASKVFNEQQIEEFRKKCGYPTLKNKVGIEMEFLSPLNTGTIANFISIGTEEEYKVKSDVSVDLGHNDRKEIESQFVTNKLRMPHFYAIEIVSPILDSQTFPNYKNICNLMSKSFRSDMIFPIATINHTCGMHINIDTTSLTDVQKESIYNLYKTVEDQISELVPPYRLQSRYCQSIRKGTKYNVDNYNKQVSLSVKDNRNEYRKFYATKKWWVVKCLVHLLDELHEYGKNNEIPFHGTFDLYAVTKYPILWHFISAQKEIIKQQGNKEYVDTPKLSLDLSVKKTQIPIIINR